MVANWAYNNCYNPEGGDRKTVHIRYSLVATDITSTDPSYCSKLVIQSYFFGTGSESVIDITPGIAAFAATMLVLLPLRPGSTFVPKIPTYFLSPYKLVNEGRF
ncbi:putative secreted protein [Operophtera brumata]|uniref:Putative secreted protein n=1 Tax=Operophtera brumata TaxID=104452 RepID=A0A0L7KXW2_OPEBR|nr:putative secreted protein [Operophtera brumata]